MGSVRSINIYMSKKINIYIYIYIYIYNIDTGI